MRTKIHFRYAVFGIIGTLTLPLALAANVNVVIDGYDYSTSSNIIYKTSTQKVKVASSIVECVDGQGGTPAVNSATVFKTNTVQLGLASVHYNINQGRLYLSTESGDVECNGGVYSDEIFKYGFEDEVFSNGFEVVP